MKVSAPVRILVLTFNRTLRGYVAELANRQFESSEEIILEIDTFSKWARTLLGNPVIMSEADSHDFLKSAAKGLGLPIDFAIEEAKYVLERFLPSDLSTYLTARRDGRGTAPRMERPMRQALLNQVILPYLAHKKARGLTDWNDLATTLALGATATEYDIVIVDETQDFSANEVRAVMNQLSPDHTITFVLDSAQRIYPRSFSWQEVGIVLRSDNSYKLVSNYRNTKQIAQFAASILAGMSVDDDGSLPNFDSATRDGPIPAILVGRFNSQMEHAMRFIRDEVDLTNESVAFLHAKGGGWFDTLKVTLDRKGLPYVSIARKANWPAGKENIALSTLHSAKGLEFDHIFILGLNAEVVPVGSDPSGSDAERLNAVRRLVAMGVGRARKTVAIGYNPTDAPDVAAFFDSAFCRKQIV